MPSRSGLTASRTRTSGRSPALRRSTSEPADRHVRSTTMSLIEKAPRVSGLCVALILAAGCDTLNIENPNAPDSKRLLSDPGSVLSLAVGAMETWFNTFENIDPGTTLSVMARSGVAAWNNFQIRFYTGCTYGASLGPMPAPYDSLGTCGTKIATYKRVEWQNDPTSTRRLQIETYWYGYYAALSSANDVVKAKRDHGGAGAGIVLGRARAELRQGLRRRL